MKIRAQSEVKMRDKAYVSRYTLTDKTVNVVSAITEIITQI